MEKLLIQREQEMADFSDLLDKLVDPAHKFGVKHQLWHGPPGIGATALRRAFEDTLIERIRDKKRLAYAALNFGTVVNEIDLLISIRVQLGKFGFDFFVFDWAFIRMFRLAHPDRDIRNQHPNLFSATGSTTADQILDWLDHLGRNVGELTENSLTFVPGFKLLKESFFGASRALFEIANQRRNRDAIAEIDKLGELELRSELAGLLARAIKRHLEECDTSGRPLGLVLLLDGCENLVTATEHAVSAGQWLDRIDCHHRLLLAAFGRAPSSEMGNVTFERKQLFPIQFHSAEAMLKERGLPPYAVQRLMGYAKGNPAALVAGIQCYEDAREWLESDLHDVREPGTLAVIKGDDTMRFILFGSRLRKDVDRKLYFRLVRNMSLPILQESIFLCCIGRTDNRVLKEAAHFVLGTYSLENTGRARRHGLIDEGIDGATGVLSSASALYSEVVFESVLEHINISLPIKQRSAIWLLQDAKTLLASGKVPLAFVLEKVESALKLRAFWNENVFDAFAALVDNLLADGEAVLAYHLGELLSSELQPKHKTILNYGFVSTSYLFSVANEVMYRAAAAPAEHALAADHALVIGQSDDQTGEGKCLFLTRAAEQALLCGDTERFRTAYLTRFGTFVLDVQDRIARITDSSTAEETIELADEVCGREAAESLTLFLIAGSRNISDLVQAVLTLARCGHQLERELSLSSGNFPQQRMLLRIFRASFEAMGSLAEDVQTMAVAAVRTATFSPDLRGGCIFLIEAGLFPTPDPDEADPPALHILATAEHCSDDMRVAMLLVRVETETNNAELIAVLEMLAPLCIGSDIQHAFLRAALKVELQIASSDELDAHWPHFAQISSFLALFAEMLIQTSGPEEAIAGKVVAARSYLERALSIAPLIKLDTGHPRLAAGLTDLSALGRRISALEGSVGRVSNA